MKDIQRHLIEGVTLLVMGILVAVMSSLLSPMSFATSRWPLTQPRQFCTRFSSLLGGRIRDKMVIPVDAMLQQQRIYSRSISCHPLSRSTRDGSCSKAMQTTSLVSLARKKKKPFSYINVGNIRSSTKNGVGQHARIEAQSTSEHPPTQPSSQKLSIEKTTTTTASQEQLRERRRRDSLRTFMLGILTIMACFMENTCPSRAAIPTMDDYYNTMSGAKIRPTKEERESMVNNELELPKIENFEDLVKAWSMLVKQAQVLPTKIQAQDFEGVLDILSSPLYKGLSAACRSNREATTAPRSCRESPIPLPEILMPSLQLLRARYHLHDDREVGEESRFTRTEMILDLDSYAYFNRVYFFNSTDKKQLAQLTKETGALENVDLSEPLDIAEDIIKYSKEVLIKLESTLS